MITSSSQRISGASPLHAVALHARYRRDRIALTASDGVRTYAGMWREACAWSAELLRRGVARGSTVALALDPSACYVELLLGALMTGAVVAPLNTRLTSSEVDQFLAPLPDVFFVASLPYDSLAPAELSQTSVVRTESAALTLRSIPGSSRTKAVDRFAGGLMLGTGGTTGIPKGAMFDHERLDRWTVSSAVMNLVRPDDVELFVSPFFHGTVVTGLLTSLTLGASVVIPDRFDPEQAAGEIASGGITRMLGAATVIERLVHAAQGLDMHDSRLRLLQFGMSSTRSGFASEIGAVFPGAAVITGYGATEFGPVTRAYGWEFDANGDPVGVGRPVPHADIVIEFGGLETVEPGVRGEILVASPWQMIGYGTASQEADVARPSAHRLRSGDVGSFDADGNLHITGRLKEMIRSGGESVYPAEVEGALHRHPAVRACAVYGRPDPRWGERVEAAVVLERPADDVELTRHLRLCLAGYKLPKRYRFLVELPMTPLGKVDRRALQEMAVDVGEGQ